jgi:hypothetical protein
VTSPDAPVGGDVDAPADHAPAQDASSPTDDTLGGEVPTDEAATTGNARVDAATARLAELDDLPTEQHADVFEDVQRRLHEALADLDDET